MDVFMHRSMRGWTSLRQIHGLSMPQFSILMQLHYKGHHCGMSEISERFDISCRGRQPACGETRAERLP
jgi:DNA-binding MarR family transcriptional regulator